jgi:hypothetical protein
MKNLLIYGSILDMLDDLTNEEAGILFKGLNDYRNGKDVVFEDRYLQGLWKGIKPNLDTMKDNYDKKVNANKENGKKGGRPPKKQITLQQLITEEEDEVEQYLTNKLITNN